MKKIITIMIFSIAVSVKGNAQTASDTLTYLQSIVINKAQYIGQPFSILMNNLQLQIKFFSPFAAIHSKRFKETSTSFAFYFPQNADEIYLTYPCLKIYWQPYLNGQQSDIIWENNNGGGWNSAAATFYSTAIISDIKLED
jgi:hypothetical protein